MDFNGQHVVVVGLARSGLAVARFLLERGARVTVSDQAGAQDLGVYVKQARQLELQLELGGHQTATFDAADWIVISPGVPHTIAPLVRARSKGIPVIGEIELAVRNIQAPIVAVSGTNGKTTTTELLGRMLAACGMRVFVGGNIGTPLIEIAGRDGDLDVVVAEISSFQLDTTEQFKPHVGVLLNITPDHLDRYGSMQAYAASKGALFKNQTSTDYAICNGSDPLVQHLVQSAASRKLDFFPHPPANRLNGQGAVIAQNHIELVVSGKAHGCIHLEKTRLFGPHNRENIAAAALAAVAVGATLAGVQKAVDEFPAMANRIEKVGTVNGVQFVNDSKATNVDAVVRALECFDSPVVLIMGGRNKGYDFSALFDHVRKRVKKLIVIGEAGPEILAALGNAPSQGVERAKDMNQAVQAAYGACQAGDIVLLSPACASFDMFANYAQRGEVFRQSVGELS